MDAGMAPSRQTVLVLVLGSLSGNPEGETCSSQVHLHGQEVCWATLSGIRLDW